MRGAGPSRSPAEGCFMRGAPPRAPRLRAVLCEGRPLALPAEGCFMRGAPPRAPRLRAVLCEGYPLALPAEGSKT